MVELVFQYQPKITVNDIKYFGISDILSKIGGLYSILLTCMVLFSMPFLKRQFNRQVHNNFHRRQEERSIKEIRQTVRERFSYVGIYDLYDRVNGIEDKLAQLDRKIEEMNKK